MSRPVIVGVVVAMLLVARTGSAAPAPCRPASLLPEATVIPVNLPAFAYSETTAQRSDIHLFAISSGADVEVPIVLGPIQDKVLKVTPSALVPGTKYRFDFPSFCSPGDFGKYSQEFTTGPETPLPSALGLLTVSSVELQEGNVVMTVKSSMPAAWQGSYKLDFVVDGGAYGATMVTRGAGDELVAVSNIGCYDLDGTSPFNKHNVALRASLPFAPQLISPPVDVHTTCPSSTTKKTGDSVTRDSSPAPSGCGIGARSSSLSIGALVLALGIVVRRRLKSSSAAEPRR